MPSPRFTTGNTYGRLNKGKPSKVKGKPHSPDCKHCMAVKTGSKFDRKTWMKEYHKHYRYRIYGLTEKQYNDMLATQKGVCAICKASPDGQWKVLCVDHDHDTGKVRGLLCVTCNTMLGRLEVRMDPVMNYLGIKYV